ncbi:hypothetical protein [Actinomadura mexicana]|nr:hypothetical protein [Actinomadura mexicana]
MVKTGRAATPPSSANAYGDAFQLMALMFLAMAAASLALPPRRDAPEPT